MNTFELAKKAKLKIVDGLDDSSEYFFPELEAFAKEVREDQNQRIIKALEASWVLCKHGCIDVVKGLKDGDV